VKINTDGAGTACVGYNDFGHCGPGKWSHDQILDIHGATDKIVAMDGWKSISHNGAWKGNFFIGTTACKNRDTALREKGLAKFEARPLEIYWSRDGDFARISRGHDTC
jgi:hypothetical protein